MRVPPTLVGYAPGGAIAARFAAGHGDRMSRLVLVDALGLTAFEPAPEFGRALNAFLAQPERSAPTTTCGATARTISTALRERMGDRWEPFRAYNVDRARAPGRSPRSDGLMADVRRRRRSRPPTSPASPCRRR